MGPVRESVRRAVRTTGRAVVNRTDRMALWRSPDASIALESDRYWNHDAQDEAWRRNSHWRSPFGDRWDAIGRETLQLSQQLARLQQGGLPGGRTIEWGAGGGANAVHFAPLCEEFVAVDVASSSLDECVRQVGAVCDTPVRPLHIRAEAPEAVLTSLDRESCDLFLCFYVLELVPSPEYGLRLLSIARDLLRPGGVAVIQMKYSTADPMTRPRRRAYRRGLADMTTYGIDEFWMAATARGLAPQAVHLVPENFLDRRYAYYLLIREEP